MISRRTLLAGAALAATLRPAAAASTTLRVGALKTGTLGWMLDTITAEGLDRREGFAIERVDYAAGQATTVALQGGAVDLIVSDWLWALRRRTDGEDLFFSPFSNALGAVMVAKDGPIRSLADLKGRKLGVAGGALDKSWVLLRAYARRELGVDMKDFAEPVYGAPPLVSEQLALGRVDAALAFWPFAARLDARGFRRLIDVGNVVEGLGITPPPPMTGFVWYGRIMQEKGAALAGFFRAVEAANRVLATSDAAWLRLKPVMQAEGEAEFVSLRDYFRAGIPTGFGAAERASCARLFEVLASVGGAELVGPDARFDPTLFWPPAA
ncbi:ABC transporter substrate-binding protein [Ancylobacter terrae]|uniref:ABC transporter substrate-binding protein n=1 Tax=Ancylobacter sp. sgz301288 TaxID=3342077 RepID=UPI0038586BC2